MGSDITAEQQQAHDIAVAAEKRTYVDPHSGYRIMTAFHLQDRGFCCHLQCRHCPWINPKDSVDEP